jgi:hypothetical protein
MGRIRAALPAVVNALLVAGVALTASLPVQRAWAQTDDDTALEAYVDKAGLWPSTQVPVCWETGADAFPDEKVWVEDAVATLIEEQSAVRFQSWENCTPADDTAQIIRITVSDEHPYSYVGRQFARDADGTLRQDAVGRSVPMPTAMVLNFTFVAAFSDVLSDSCGGRREHCIRAIAVHEFLHALGFLHEQLREDAPAECKQRFAHLSDFPGWKPLRIGDYDPDSHMNYCANMYREPIRLSEQDVAILNAFYHFQ